MATAYGGRVGQFAATIAVNVVLTTSTTDLTFTIPVGHEGYIDINKCLVNITTAVAFTTAAPTILIKKGSTLIGTYTAVTGDALGYVFTPASGKEAGENLVAGDTIVVSTTAGTGGTPAGIGVTYLALYLSSLSR